MELKNMLKSRHRKIGERGRIMKLTMKLTLKSEGKRKRFKFSWAGTIKKKCWEW